MALEALEMREKKVTALSGGWKMKVPHPIPEAPNLEPSCTSIREESHRPFWRLENEGPTPHTLDPKS